VADQAGGIGAQQAGEMGVDGKRSANPSVPP